MGTQIGRYIRGLAQKQDAKTATNEHPDRWITVVIGTLKGQFDEYFKSLSRAGGGVLGEGEGSIL